MVGTCSPVDQMYVTAMPAIATFTMAENHIKTDSIRLQLQAEYWYEQGTTTSMIQPPIPSTKAPQPRHITFLTTKVVVEKTRNTTVRRAPVLGQGSACARGEGGYTGFFLKGT